MFVLGGAVLGRAFALTGDGTRGWLELEDFGDVKREGRYAADFFEGLSFAD